LGSAGPPSFLCLAISLDFDHIAGLLPTTHGFNAAKLLPLVFGKGRHEIGASPTLGAKVQEQMIANHEDEARTESGNESRPKHF
jgi:hypothetical protein